MKTVKAWAVTSNSSLSGSRKLNVFRYLVDAEIAMTDLKRDFPLHAFSIKAVEIREVRKPRKSK